MSANKTNDTPIIARKEAMRIGQKRYFTGKPCKYGHVDERTVSNGVCMECSRIKTRNFWEENPEAKAKNQADGNALGKIKYREDKDLREKIKQRSKDWYHANKGRYQETRSKWYKKNKETANAKCRKRWSDNRKNPEWVEKERFRKREEMKTHPERARASHNARRARMKKIEGKVRPKDIKEKLDSQKYKCVYCGVSLKEYYEVDHITPVSKGGTNWPSNIQCLCRSCNRAKSAKDPIDFAQEKGMLL